ncbi:MASE1 domain-containing protein [Streptomyces sp. NPDC052225]|uniref:MASE1 domain-containing protein n=1 Tax=Streptomyces sp. NPDC052225 TaxID=3154949 RepID=UPI00343FCEA3
MACVLVFRRPRWSLDLVLKALAVAVCYYVAGRLGLMGQLVIEGVIVTPVWPPTGLALAALLVFGVGVWPGIALGSLLVIASLTTPQLPTLITVAGNTAAPLCACLLLHRVGFRLDVSRLRDGIALVFLGGLGAMAISATAGVAPQVWTGGLSPGQFWSVWLAWWVGDAMGVLLVTPLLLVLSLGAGRFPRRRWKEAVCLGLAALVIVPVAVLSPTSMLFLVFPLLIWAALRFQLAGSMLCALVASVLTTYAANTRVGAFSGLSGIEIMVKLQAFNGAAALTALLLSSLVTEQRATRRSVQSACNELAVLLEHLAVGENPADPSAPSVRDVDEARKPTTRHFPRT